MVGRATEVVLLVARRNRGAPDDVQRVASALGGLGVAVGIETIAKFARRGAVRAPAAVVMCESSELRGPLARAIAGASRAARLAPPARTLRAAAGARLLRELRARGVAIGRAARSRPTSRVSETTSLLAFGGVFSHAVRRPLSPAASPAPRGAARARRAAAVRAATAELLFAHHVLEQLARHAGVPEPPPVVRVDVGRDAAGGLVLLGVDCAPGRLYLETSPGSARKCADAIFRWAARPSR